MTNWENIYKQYNKGIIFFIYNDCINKKTTNASEEKWAKDMNKDFTEKQMFILSTQNIVNFTSN